MPGKVMSTIRQEMPLCFGRVGVRAHIQLTPVGPLPERGPDLLSVDHEVIAVADRAGAQRGEVGARFGFRHSLAPDIVGAHHAGEKGAILGFRPVLHDRRRDVVHTDDVERQWSSCAGGLLGVCELLEHRRSAAAELFRPGYRSPTCVRCFGVPRAKRLERGVTAAATPACGHDIIGQVGGQPRAQRAAERFHLGRV